jgi:hypothetical protein
MSRFYQRVISLSKTREDFAQPIDKAKLTTVVDKPTITVVSDKKTTVVSNPRPAVPSPATTVVDGRPALWRAESNGALFPASRVRRVERAQDALTHAEECVYDCLWGPKNSSKDNVRIAKIGYDRISKAARITKRNAALIIERLIEKGFIKLEKPADPLHRIPSEYRVMSYKAALEELGRMHRHWVVRSGNGVLFVHSVSVSVEATTTVVDDAATTVVTATTVSGGAPTTVIASTTDTVGAEQSTTVVAATTHLDNKDKAKRHTSSSALADVCSQHEVVLDAAAERTIIKRCRAYDSAAAEDEIAHFAGIKINQLKTSRNVGNLVGLLMIAIPEFFVEPAHELQRYRAGKAERSSSRLDLAQRVLTDPNASEPEKQWANAIVQELK